MFDFLSRGRPKSSAKTKAPATRAPTGPKSGTPPSATQREMVRLTLHSVLRNKGIPGNWLTCEIVPIQIIGQGDAILVQLVVLKWHDALMQYAPALQQGLLEGLKQFDANASATKYQFSWAFAPDCGCPHTQFPESSFWNTGVTPTALTPIAGSPATTATPVATPGKPKFDLPSTAADLRSDDDDDDHGFAATQINGS